MICSLLSLAIHPCCCSIPYYCVVFHCMDTTVYPFVFFFFFPFILMSWRLITLQYCRGFCHTLTWISHGFTLFPIPIPPPASLPIPSLWVFPVHQPWALVSCIQPGLVICFTLNSILVSMLFSQNIPPLPSPTESQSLFCTCVSFSVLHIGLSLPSF